MNRKKPRKKKSDRYWQGLYNYLGRELAKDMKKGSTK
jgi:predicted RNA-binding protein with PUA-like domain